MLIWEVSSYLTIFLITLASGQSTNNCEFKGTCKECIQEFDCVWCIVPKNTTVHCFPNTESSNWCENDMLVTLKQNYTKLRNDDFSSTKNNTIQIRPQRVKLSLRKGQKYEHTFTFKAAANYPIDLYYLMDLSKSMEEHKNTLASLGISLANAMRNITTNFKLGFGSFIDKRELPFVSTVPSKLASPCKTNKGTPCASPYSFKNHMNLTDDFEAFKMVVNSARVSGNLDSPEGGLDAIMQAIVCKGDIGWTDKARHLLVFSTDAEYHIAGDGKLAGVVEPNPAVCYKDDSDYLKYDYPSVSQINYVAKENNINIIFAIIKKKAADSTKAYKQLSNYIENSNYGQVEDKEGGKNIVNLIVDNYNKIAKTIRFTHDAPKEVDIKFESNCNSSMPDRCENVHVGEEFNFTTTIELRECPQNGSLTKNISIIPGTINERLVIELEFLCDCPCSSQTDSTFQPNAKECNNAGNLICGVCDCSPERFGRDCQCNTTQTTLDNVDSCKMAGSDEVCSGLGICKCGKCECNTNSINANDKSYGQFCECNDYSCPRKDGLLCSNKGNCKCKKCDCFGGYSGNICEIKDSQDNCIDDENNGICSNETERITCEGLRHCVQCQVFNSGIYENNCTSQCTTFQTIKLPDLSKEDVEGIKECRIPDNDTCNIYFDYYYDDNDKKLIVMALDRKICPEPPNVLAWVLGVTGSILLAGLILLLIWKVFTTYHDRREYEKFENERKKMKWGAGDNPLYREATSTFANPAYKRGSVRLSFNKK